MIDARELFEKYKAGHCSAEEIALLEKWFHHLGEEDISDLTALDLMQAKEDFKGKIKEITKKKKVFALWPRIAAAASLIIGLGIAVYLYQSDSNIDSDNDLLALNDVVPGGNKAILTLADGRKIDLSDAGNGELAEQSGIVITKTEDGQLVYQVLDNVETAPAAVIYNTIETPVGGQYQVVLPDGSKVWLNAASSLKFPSSFASLSERKVELAGEAYFEVAKDKLHPFKVVSADQEVTVLGTHFNINSYKDDGAVRTTLLEGRVKVKTRTVSKDGVYSEVTLRAGEQAVLTNKGVSIIEKDVKQVIDWKNGDFIFQKESIGSIMNRIARWYNVEIAYAEGIDRQMTFSGRMSRKRELKDILNKISSTGEITFKIEDSTVKVLAMP
ncbi:FecR family protein [Sphingobacterium lumbrici]|uniref:FecR family protein n=1 Tax=Sphingobacterium lumbrici TaxID=2559600 RepID=UPI00112B9370|nr:FecR family protein [Sphingobacterium lumbrici]